MAVKFVEFRIIGQIIMSLTQIKVKGGTFMRKILSGIGAAIILIILPFVLITSCKQESEEAEPSIETAKSELTPIEELGKNMFFDSNLSAPEGQACGACHSPAVGWAGPDSDINNSRSVYEGAVRGRFGNRRPPTAAYAGDSPPLHRDEE